MFLVELRIAKIFLSVNSVRYFFRKYFLSKSTYIGTYFFVSYTKGAFFMKYNFIGKNMVVSDSLKERTEKKLSKLDKFLHDDAVATVTFSTIKTQNIIEVTIPIKKRVLRAEVSEDDMFNSIDRFVDILEKQLRRYKTRLRDKSRREPKYKDELLSFAVDDATLDTEGNITQIEKTKKFTLKPMETEEAIMEMELLDHDFFVFLNGASGEVNVIYRRKNGSYGLIEPEI